MGLGRGDVALGGLGIAVAALVALALRSASLEPTTGAELLTSEPTDPASSPPPVGLPTDDAS